MNPLKNILHDLLYDPDRKFSARITKKELPENIEMLKGMSYKEMVAITFPKKEGGIEEQSIGRIVRSEVDYWTFNSIYEGQLIYGIPNGFGRLITARGE